jgi:hypothetical protein
MRQNAYKHGIVRKHLFISRYDIPRLVRRPTSAEIVPVRSALYNHDKMAAKMIVKVG